MMVFWSSSSIFSRRFDFGLGDLHDRHAGPHGDHFGNILAGNHRAFGAFPAGFHLLELFVQVGFLGLPGAHVLGLAFFLGQGPVGTHQLQLLVNLLGRRGRAGFVHAHARSRLVDQVDGLVGQETVRYVTGRKLGGRFERLVRDDQVVMLFIHLADTLEDFNGLFNRRFIHHDRLEAAFEGRIGFDVLAVFVQRGGADALQFTARKRRFENIGRVHGRTGRTGSHQHVEFVNEQDGLGGLEFVDDALQAFLELAAVHRPGHQRTHIQFQDAFVQQRRGDIAVGDALGQPFDDGGLADARFADQGRVVLGAARQDLDDALDLGLAPDDRVQLAFFGQGGQVGCQLVHQRGLGFLLAARFGCLRDGRSLRSGAFLQHTAGLAAHLFGGHPQFLEHFHRCAFRADQPKQQMFGANVMMAHLAGFFDGIFQHQLRIGGEFDLAAFIVPLAADPLDHLTHPFGLQAKFAQNTPGHPAVFRQ